VLHPKTLARAIWHHKYTLGTLLVLLGCIVFGPLTYTFLSSRGNRYDLDRTSINSIPHHHVAIVFGAGIFPNGTPTPFLQYRITTAVKLYQAHRVDILLMTGDNSTRNHNEPQVMKHYAIKLGVPSKAIVVDDAGFDTYDSCYRAHAIFKLNDATLVSQGYHLPRALATCKGLGIQSTGVIAIHPERDFALNNLARELLSTDKMVVQLTFKPKATILGPPLPIRQ
jgi:vancomycin permeability regulator SanA